MSLLKLFQKARSTAASTSETAVEATADSQSAGAEQLDKANDLDDLGSDLESDKESTDAEDDETVPPPTKKACGAECGDIASYISKSQQLSDAVRYQLLVSHFKPNATFKFPRSANGRSFQFRWLQQHPWLCYSKQENGGVCLPCVLFASGGYHGSDPGILVR